LNWLETEARKGKLEIQFETKILEYQVRQLCDKKEEVFAGLLIRVPLGRSDKKILKIAKVLVCPNFSTKATEEARPPSHWMEMLNETARFYSHEYYREDEYLALGWLHSHPHPDGINEFSDNDFNYMRGLAYNYWFMDGHFAVLVTTNGKRQFRFLCNFACKRTDVATQGKREPTDFIPVPIRSFYFKPRSL
jgi:proteasome lid subunit RPN8/RPN11